MSSEGSVSRWIDQLKAGDQAAAGKLWEGYFQKLVALARKRLKDTPRRAADEEDIALSAFDSLCRRAERGQFAQLLDRNDLWQLLVLITVRKVCDLKRREQREGRRRTTRRLPLRGDGASSKSSARNPPRNWPHKWPRNGNGSWTG
jgi:DNA-directed RNA polymerase specialized sigma24 family protein